MPVRKRWLAAPVLAVVAVVVTGVSVFAAGSPAITKVGSDKWAGYAVVGAPGSVKTVSAMWTVPEIHGCAPTGEQVSLAWVGIDGAGANGHVQQVGTEQACENGTPVYQVFYETAPAPPRFAFALSPGDQVKASVTSLGNGSYSLSLLDQTTGEHFAATVTAPPSNQTFDQTGEAIFEVPTRPGYPNVGGVSFHNVKVAGQHLGAFDTLYAVAMIGPSGPVYVPSVPPGTPSDFSVFRVG